MNDKEKSKRKNLLSITEMKQKYPSSKYKVIGEYVLKKPLKKYQGYQVELLDGTSLYVKNSGFYKRTLYQVFGYQETTNEGEYVAVLRRTWKLPILILLIVFALSGGYWAWKQGQGPDIDPAIKDYVSQLKRPENLDETKILIPGFSALMMDADTDVLKTTLFNPQDNPCYFQFTVVQDNGEVLYESKLVPPGKGVEEVKLNKKMAEGVYSIIVKIKSYDINDYTKEFNGAEVQGTLRVLQ